MPENIQITEQELRMLPRKIREEVLEAADRHARAAARLDRLYEHGAPQEQIDRAEVRVARLEEVYFGVVAAAFESEHDEPSHQEVPLDLTFAELYAEHERGWQRHGITLPELLRQVAMDHRDFKGASDFNLVEAARDAYEHHRDLRARRGEKPAEKERIAEALRQRRFRRGQ